MPGTSKITKSVAFRLPNEVYAVLERRIKRSNNRWEKVSDYLKYSIARDALRKR